MLEAGIYSFHRYWLGWTTIHGYDPDKAMQEWNGMGRYQVSHDGMGWFRLSRDGITGMIARHYFNYVRLYRGYFIISEPKHYTLYSGDYLCSLFV